MTNSHGVRPGHGEAQSSYGLLLGKVGVLTQQVCEGKDSLDVMKTSFVQISMHLQAEMRVGTAFCPKS